MASNKSFSGTSSKSSSLSIGSLAASEYFSLNRLPSLSSPVAPTTMIYDTIWNGGNDWHSIISGGSCPSNTLAGQQQQQQQRQNVYNIPFSEQQWQQQTESGSSSYVDERKQQHVDAPLDKDTFNGIAISGVDSAARNGALRKTLTALRQKAIATKRGLITATTAPNSIDSKANVEQKSVPTAAVLSITPSSASCVDWNDEASSMQSASRHEKSKADSNRHASSVCYHSSPSAICDSRPVNLLYDDVAMTAVVLPPVRGKQQQETTAPVSELSRSHIDRNGFAFPTTVNCTTDNGGIVSDNYEIGRVGLKCVDDMSPNTLATFWSSSNKSKPDSGTQSSINSAEPTTLSIQQHADGSSQNLHKSVEEHAAAAPATPVRFRPVQTLSKFYDDRERRRQTICIADEVDNKNVATQHKNPQTICQPLVANYDNGDNSDFVNPNFPSFFGSASPLAGRHQPPKKQEPLATALKTSDATRCDDTLSNSTTASSTVLFADIPNNSDVYDGGQSEGQAEHQGQLSRPEFASPLPFHTTTRFGLNGMGALDKKLNGSSAQPLSSPSMPSTSVSSPSPPAALYNCQFQTAATNCQCRSTAATTSATFDRNNNNNRNTFLYEKEEKEENHTSTFGRQVFIVDHRTQSVFIPSSYTVVKIDDDDDKANANGSMTPKPAPPSDGHSVSHRLPHLLPPQHQLPPTPGRQVPPPPPQRRTGMAPSPLAAVTAPQFDHHTKTGRHHQNNTPPPTPLTPPQQQYNNNNRHQQQPNEYYNVAVSSTSTEPLHHRSVKYHATPPSSGGGDDDLNGDGEAATSGMYRDTVYNRRNCGEAHTHMANSGFINFGGGRKLQLHVTLTEPPPPPHHTPYAATGNVPHKNNTNFDQLQHDSCCCCHHQPRQPEQNHYSRSRHQTAYQTPTRANETDVGNSNDSDEVFHNNGAHTFLCGNGNYVMQYPQQSPRSSSVLCIPPEVLQQIKHGVPLRPTLQTNDRSAPYISSNYGQ